MRRWLFALWGLIGWAVHFVGLYAIASLGDLLDRPEAQPWRGLALAFSLLCFGGVIWGLVTSLRSLGRDADSSVLFLRQIAVLGCLTGLLAVAWQTAPLIIG